VVARIVAVLVVVILLGFVMLVAFGSNPPAGVLAWFARFQHEPSCRSRRS
jgi:hypothetical protein